MASTKINGVTFRYRLKKYSNPMEGMARNPINWIPKVSPTKKAIRMRYRLPRGFSRLSVHFRPSHNSSDIMKLAMAYTSVSTALNQKLSENVRARQPTSPLPRMAMAWALFRASSPPTSFRPRLVMVQNMKRMAKAEETPDI